MQPLAFLLILAGFCCLGSSQTDSQDALVHSVKFLIQKIETLSTTVEGLNVKIDAMQEKNLPGNLLDQTCKIRHMEAMQEYLQTEFQATKNALRECSLETQLSNLQELFATDECATGVQNCSPYATCTDSLIHYSCECLPGYSGDGYTCEEIDECMSDEHDCHEQGVCENTVGSYTCSCLLGLTGDGVTCEDIDECNTGVDSCHEQAQCVNTEGSYHCTCLNGSYGDGFFCTTPPCPPPSKLLEGFGCVIPVLRSMTWKAAKRYCHDKGTRLLEGITTQEELMELKEHFNGIIGQNIVWIGMKREQWIEEDEQLDPDSPLWAYIRRIRKKRACGNLRLSYDQLSIHETTCSFKTFALCQGTQWIRVLFPSSSSSSSFY